MSTSSGEAWFGPVHRAAAPAEPVVWHCGDCGRKHVAGTLGEVVVVLGTSSALRCAACYEPKADGGRMRKGPPPSEPARPPRPKPEPLACAHCDATLSFQRTVRRDPEGRPYCSGACLKAGPLEAPPASRRPEIERDASAAGDVSPLEERPVAEDLAEPAGDPEVRAVLAEPPAIVLEEPAAIPRCARCSSAAPMPVRAHGLEFCGRKCSQGYALDRAIERARAARADESPAGMRRP